MPSRPSLHPSALGCATDVTYADLRALSHDDPWLRWGLPDPLSGHALVRDGVAVVQRLGHRPGLWVAPLRPSQEPGAVPQGGGLAEEAGRVRSALQHVMDEDLLARWAARSVSVPQEHAEVGHEVLPLSDQGGDWEWMWATTVPDPLPGEESLVLLDDLSDAEELLAFAHQHNPRVWTRIGEGVMTRWVGLRGPDGELLAVGGAETERSGVPHLAGILTATHARGRGLGEMVSAALTRWALEHHGVSTLGMYSDNEVARRLYRRLGYRTARAWHSRQLDL
ncbi:GNAT family N-acetyltransferase [Ornithinimicrobium sufpigmenti]|uniref:GNAT family N-acetyltransferase n=1 Tax=Ornithinimicrobium sufpigmenti TaxID=2508882 RepID=UPI001036A38A|nr:MULTISPECIES: GNAT family N-acetyltransferase [unclassified Ornithinimicrobium]